jgi:Zn-dependent peptidase ImmA (M78 family)
MAVKYQKAKEQAAWLVEKYALTMPFSVFDLAELLRIGALELSPADLYETVKQLSPDELNGVRPEDILGYFSANDNTVYLNADQSVHRMRFTMAHEIGHQQLHKNSGKNHFRKSFSRQDMFSPQSELETEANYFAGYLLVPDEYIEKTLPYTKLMHGGEFMINELNKFFGISKEATRIRLKTFKEENPEIWEEYDLSKKLF